MEVVSESEALEICKSNGYDFIGIEYGSQGNLVLVANKLKNNFEKYQNATSSNNTVVYAETGTGRMYLADRSKSSYATTFNIAHAKRFKSTEASQKAYMMTVKGTYNWKTLKLK